MDLSPEGRERSRAEDLRLRALRGATTVAEDEAEDIVAATAELLTTLFERNDVRPEQLVSLIFTATEDLGAEFPAVAARRLGIAHVPLLCAREMAVPGSVARCVRVLVHLYTERDYANLRHVYLGEARELRADLAE